MDDHGLDIDEKRLKSRKGSIPTNVQTLMKEAEMAAFVDEVHKISADEQAVTEAVSKLQKPRPWKVIGQTAGLVGAVAPAIDVAGKFTKGVVDARGGLGARLAGGASEVGKITAGDLLSKSLTSGLGGGAIAAAKEGIELHNARKAIHNYLSEKVSLDIKSLFTETPEEQELAALRAKREHAESKAALKGGAGAAAIMAPAWLTGHAAERLLGTQRILHGTGSRAAESILREGLDPSRGGSGGATWEGSRAYQKGSKGHVHVAVPSEPFVGGEHVARFYARMGGDVEKGRAASPLGNQLAAAVSSGHGKVLSGAMPYEQFVRDFVLDPDYQDVPGAAFRSAKPLDPSHLGEDSILNRAKKMLQHRAPDLAGYAKRNPKRVASGVGLLAASAAAPVAGYHLLKSIGGDLAQSRELREQERALREKMSTLFGGAPAGPKVATPSAPSLGVLRGSSNKGQRVGNTPIAAKSGTTRSSSGDPMNPRRNLSDAMQAYKA